MKLGIEYVQEVNESLSLILLDDGEFGLLFFDENGDKDVFLFPESAYESLMNLKDASTKMLKKFN